jgi:hypothetical protein
VPSKKKRQVGVDLMAIHHVWLGHWPLFLSKENDHTLSTCGPRSMEKQSVMTRVFGELNARLYV